jgi:NAD(P)-dependent dehydrogenase (short-subunit alcohol dehydrogenase family)
VITGATSGIGRAAACMIAGLGADLILLGRREKIGEQLASTLRNKPGAGSVEFHKTDLSTQQNVRSVAANIINCHPRIDILVNNAGARFNHFQQSSDGIELTFATNHLGHFLLTNLLLPALLQAPCGRIVTVASGAHSGISSEGDWCLKRENYDRKLAYGKSKLANLVFAYELARRLRGTTVVSNAVNPGGVATNMGRNNGLVSWCRHLTYYALKGRLLSPRRGAETLVYLALDSGVERVSGKYFFQKREIDSSPASYDVRAASELWKLSLALTQLDKVESPLLSAVN